MTTHTLLNFTFLVSTLDSLCINWTSWLSLIKHQHNRKTQYFKKKKLKSFQEADLWRHQQAKSRLASKKSGQSKSKESAASFCIWGFIAFLNFLGQVSSTLFFRRTSRLEELFPPPRLQQHKSEGRLNRRIIFPFFLNKLLLLSGKREIIFDRV